MVTPYNLARSISLDYHAGRKLHIFNASKTDGARTVVMIDYAVRQCIACDGYRAR